MKKGNISLVIKMLFFNILLYFVSRSSFGQDPRNILDSMFTSIDNLTAIEFKFRMEERLRNDQFIIHEGLIKSSLHPLKIYYYENKPHEGLEIIYHEDEKNLAIVHTNQFPRITIRAHPLDRIMRRERHYSLIESTIFPYMKEHLEHLVREKSKPGSVQIELIKNSTDSRYYELMILNHAYNIFKFKTNERIHSYHFSANNHINEYKLLEINDLNYSKTFERGEEICIPSDFAKIIILRINRKNYMPYIIEIHDDKGLFEKYYFKRILINPIFCNDVFDSKNAKYHF
ncbi:hypothetical protein ACFLSA_04685 [Bacteroidota bacterium]